MALEFVEHIDFFSMTNSNECQRLFHGRGHVHEGLEYINLDWLPPVLMITLYREVGQQALADLAGLLIKQMPACESVQVQYRSRPLAPVEVLTGSEITELNVTEHGLKYHLQLGRAQNLGLFLDMSNGRKWITEHAKDKTVLNLFAYTCAFSVAALAGGARHVFNVDNNRGVLNRGRENHQLNKLDMRAVRFDKIDVFKSFGRLKKYGPYDLLISDPPSFQQGSVDIKQDYSKIVRRLPQLMSPGGKIMLCLNSPDLSEEFLYQIVEDGCPDCQFVEQIKPPPVFKEAVAGKGLKVLVFQFEPGFDGVLA